MPNSQMTCLPVPLYFHSPIATGGRTLDLARRSRDQGRTRIKYMTDSMLFRETMLDPLLDPLLSKYLVDMVNG